MHAPRTGSRRSLRVSTAIGLLLAAAPRAASASPTYPGLIDTDLSLTYDLGTTHCTICHLTNSGGVGTAIQPFASAMKAAGLTLENPPALEAALATLEANGTDSDCNGIPDIQQIKEGRNPNTGAYIDGSGRTAPADPGCGADAGAITSDLPVYGCGAQLAPGAAGSAGAGSAGLLAALALSLVRRRSRALTD